ncbi:uncharacterized protein N7496_002437 [Penicillium cataractarum]|uniref:Uncharacterized protein n=1 Tax=Penicillium cataractarum TaxID=2100454 RepID=A0A9W9SLT0_9EURO|nr:uncharacterized protein N7496_002437 [Penicillium cataractarum]KAJ5380009.1 hypothetical protein N7496_002437 [Penicillium cataractarum]
MSAIPATTQQGPVEARSLSSITAIASNPPAYPRNPTHEKHDPLQLYIVRVPGSQDIFLSPVKPPTKSSVSAEAINASLYYLHVATPEDDALLQEVEQEREKQLHRRKEELEAAGIDDPAHREFARLNNVRRKPVGGERESRSQENLSTPAAIPALTPGLENVAPPRVPVPRRPVPGAQVSAENVSFAGTLVANAQPEINDKPRQGSVDSIGNAASRRPLPPLPPNEEPLIQDPSSGDDQPRKTNRWSAFMDNVQARGKEVWKEKYETISAGRHSLDANRPQLPPRPLHDGSRSPNRSPGQSPSRQAKQHQPSRGNAGFRITLIRRDPASGTQWNVATISTPRMDRNAVDIEISTPGYNRFAGSNEPLSLASLAANLPPGMLKSAGPSLAASLGLEKPTETQPQTQPQPQPSGPRKFHRQLCVSRQFEDPHGNVRSAVDSGNGHVPEGSKLKSGYYVFNSPWNGTCTFSSSVNGRSLKCKHMISTPGHAPTGDSDANPAVTVAEIRFNTPFQAANLHFHASHASHPQPQPHHAFISPTHQTQTQPPNDPPSPNSSTQTISPDPAPTPAPTPPYTPDTPNASTTTPRTPFSPTNLIRRTSLRSPRFSRGEFRHQYPAPPSHRRSTSASSGGPDSDEDRLDFSLARELAGGGMRGKSAKLGKLVIEDEGIKMLDLVVAACMAVWWRGYYH